MSYTVLFTSRMMMQRYRRCWKTIERWAKQGKYGAYKDGGRWFFKVRIEDDEVPPDHKQMPGYIAWKDEIEDPNGL